MSFHNPFADPNIEEMIAQIPEEHRGPWLQVIESRKERDRQLEEAIETGDWKQALVLSDSKERAQTFQRIADDPRLTDETVRELLTRYWSLTEGWSGDERLRDAMYGLLHRVAPLYVEGEPPQANYLTLYRGNTGETPGPWPASWTLDLQVAEQFGRMAMSARGMVLGMYREDGIPTVWRASARRDDVLGYFNDRGEQEIVIDGHNLENLERIREAR